MKALPPDQVAAALPTIPAWNLEQGMIVRDFTFPSFADAIAFVNHAATLAETQDHHPDIDIRFTRVRLALLTHAAQGLTRRDFHFAQSIDQALPQPAADRI